MTILYHIHEKGNSCTKQGYIGVTQQKLEDRIYQHKTDRRVTMYSIFQDLGESNIEITILSKGENPKLMYNLEYIFRPLPNMGWNISRGGLGYNPTGPSDYRFDKKFADKRSKAAKKGEEVRRSKGFYKSESFLEGRKKAGLKTVEIKKSRGFYESEEWEIQKKKAGEAASKSIRERKERGDFDKPEYLEKRKEIGNLSAKKRKENGYFKSEEFLKKSHPKSIETRKSNHPNFNKPVNKLDYKTESVIQRFESIREAAKEMLQYSSGSNRTEALRNITSRINNCCKGTVTSCLKFKWQYA